MEIKTCCHCKEALSLDSFQKNQSAPDGLQYRCKACTRKASKACRAKRAHLWAEKLNPWKNRPENRERINAATRARQARRSPEIKRAERYRWILVWKYGLSVGLKQRLLERQDYECLICDRKIDLYCAVDHDHKSDCVRGMLCKPCNSALGLFQDDPEILKRAATYLEESKFLSDEPTEEDFETANKLLGDYNGSQEPQSIPIPKTS